MRIDAIAYQRATRVAAIGLGLQVAMALILFFFGLAARDDTIAYASFYVAYGFFVWLALVIVFKQHKLERLEALEGDELQRQRRAGVASAFDSESEEFNLAARRLRLMHKWLMPIITWVMIILLAGTGLLLLSILRSISGPTTTSDIVFDVIAAQSRGWGLAICLALATISFICSRFVAGMARQAAWQNLRGGAGYMVGNALVMLAVATGIIFTYFDNEAVIRAVAPAILIFEILLAAEFLLNFLLNLYRPRRAGEVPRPAFDSRLLSMLSAPDSIIRSINEAINYQFGFDITGSWGYQLLLRAGWKLAVFAIAVMVVLNCMVLVEPHQQAIRLRGGEIRRVADSGLMWKWPWPFETAEVFDVARIRSLPLTIQLRETPEQRNEPILWAEGLGQNLGIEPFIVSTHGESASPTLRTPGRVTPDGGDEADATADQAALVSQNFALVEAGFVLDWRLRPDDGNSLRKFLNFSSSSIERRQPLTTRERAIKALALHEVSLYLSRQDLDRVISNDRAEMISGLRDRVQEVFDRFETGVEVVAISNPWIRPAGSAGTTFEELSFNFAAFEKDLAEAERLKIAALTTTAGSPENAERLIGMIDEYDRMAERGAAEDELDAQNKRIEDALMESGGVAAQMIADAHAERWSTVLLAQAQLEKLRGRLAPYRAGPEIYRQYLLMDTLGYVLDGRRKFFFGIDPGNITFSIEMQQDDQSQVFSELMDIGGNANESQ